MKKTYFKVKMTFLEPILGSQSGDPEILKTFVTSKAPTPEAKIEETKVKQAMQPSKEEVEEQIQEEIIKSTTLFPKDETGLFVWDYQLRGAFKENLGVLIELGDITTVSKWLYKKAVDSFVFVTPRRCYFKDPQGNICKQPTGMLQRSLRAVTLQGERICLASSETLPPGTSVEFITMLLEVDNKKSKMALTKEMLIAALDYGSLKGFGQWRSGGFGRYQYAQSEIEEKEALAPAQ